MNRIVAAAIAFVVTVLSSPASAQTGQLTVTALRADQQPAVGAVVRVTGTATGVSRSGIADPNGQVLFQSLAQGFYVVRCDMSGYGTVRIPDVPVSTGSQQIDCILTHTKVPVRWCAVAEAPSIADPTLVGASSIEGVLLGRQAGANNLIVIPQTDIAYRSAFSGATSPQNFPVFPDPDVTTGTVGDVNGTAEFNLVVNECRQRWQAISEAIGLTAIQIGLWNGTYLVGGVTMRPQHCNGADQLVMGAAILMDPSYWSSNPCTAGPRIPISDAKTVAHELSHALSLTHGDGHDTDGDGTLDEFDEGDPTEGSSLMQSGFCFTAPQWVDAIVVTPEQATWMQEQAQMHIPDIQIDPIVPPTAALRVDRVRENEELRNAPYLDVDAIALTANDARTTMALSTFGIFGGDVSVDYYFLLDLDDNPRTGGRPSRIGIRSSMAGVELVGQVKVSVRNGTLSATPAVWRYRDNRFHIVSDPGIRASAATSNIIIDFVPGDSVTPPRASESLPASERISLTVPNRIRGALGKSSRLGAISREERRNVGDNHYTRGERLVFERPAAPICYLTPSAPRPGEAAVLHAKDLPRGADVLGRIGGHQIGRGTTGKDGELEMKVSIPSDLKPGLTLVTVAAGAVTADCHIIIED